MDHLDLPYDCTRESVEVPYICTEEYNEPQPGYLAFSFYFESKGWKHQELRCRKAWDANYRCADDDDPEKQCQVHRCSCKRPHDVEKNAAFLQTWLYFGLLKVILGRKRMCTSDFVRVNNQGEKCITTQKLPELIKDWAVEFKDDFSPQEKPGTEHYWEYCLGKAQEVYTYISHSSTVDPRILLSIGILGETLVGAVNKTTRISASELDSWKHESSLAENEVTRWLSEKMLEDGWCPADMKRLGWFNLTSLWFISNMGSFRGGPVHGKCKPDHCHLLEGYLKDYETKHVDPECDCKPVFAEQLQLQAILENRQIPLVVSSLQEDDEAQTIKLREFRDYETPYIAISHVWADGLGSSSNSLPRCQLRKLNKLVHDLFPRPVFNMSFWIDTLACPVSPPESKVLALELMGETYKKAHRVLVLDASLMCVQHRKMSRRELVMRIFLSTWVRRLWCYQEGIFAKSLYFQFADGPWEFDSAESWAKALSLVEDDAGAYMLTHHYQQIRDRRVQSHRPHEERLWAVANALRGRWTSKQADEAICLASLLDVDVEPIAKLKGPEQRMKAFWQAMSPCYRDFVFWQGECLQEKGYRWAPSTFISAAGDILAPFRHDSPREQLAIPKSEGLLFQSPGILLGQVKKGLQLFWLRNIEKRGAHDPELPFFVVFPQPFEPDQDGAELGLILHSPIVASTQVWDARQVVVTKISRTENNVIYGTTLMLANLCGRNKLEREGGGATSGPRNVLEEVQQQLDNLPSTTLKKNHRWRFWKKQKPVPIPQDLSTILVDGRHSAFELKCLPESQMWCVERDIHWVNTLQRDAVHFDDLPSQNITRDVLNRADSFLEEQRREAQIRNHILEVLRSMDDDAEEEEHDGTCPCCG